jgi:transposase
MPRSKPPYPAQFREQMVELARAGRGLKQLSREFGVSANAIRMWVQRADGDAPPAMARGGGEQLPLSAAERQELIELRRRLKQVQTERDILAKATAWFAVKSERTSTTSSSS